MGNNTTRLAVKISVAVIAFLWAFIALSYLIFGILGKTQEDAAWSYALVLYVSLAIANLGVSLKIWTKHQSIGNYLSATATGAILGFFSIGWIANESSEWASAGAIAGGIISFFATYKAVKQQNFGQKLVLIAINTANAVAVYGFALLVGANAIALLAGGYLVAGISCGVITIYSLWLTIKAATHIFSR